MIPLTWYLALSAVLFTIGVVGVITKRNAIQMFMCIELMLNAVNLTFVAFSSYFGDVTGQLFVFIVMTVAAAEAAVGLGIIIAIFRNRESLADIIDRTEVRKAPEPAPDDAHALTGRPHSDRSGHDASTPHSVRGGRPAPDHNGHGTGELR